MVHAYNVNNKTDSEHNVRDNTDSHDVPNMLRLCLKQWGIRLLVSLVIESSEEWRRVTRGRSSASHFTDAIGHGPIKREVQGVPEDGPFSDEPA